MKFIVLVALSHLRSRRDEAGISVITLVSMIGVTVGVTALIMVLAVMEGFELDLRDKILGSNAHVMVMSYNGILPTRASFTNCPKRQVWLLPLRLCIRYDDRFNNRATAIVMKGLILKRRARLRMWLQILWDLLVKSNALKKKRY